MKIMNYASWYTDSDIQIVEILVDHEDDFPDYSYIQTYFFIPSIDKTFKDNINDFIEITKIFSFKSYFTLTTLPDSFKSIVQTQEPDFETSDFRFLYSKKCCCGANAIHGLNNLLHMEYCDLYNKEFDPRLSYRSQNVIN